MAKAKTVVIVVVDIFELEKITLSFHQGQNDPDDLNDFATKKRNPTKPFQGPMASRCPRKSRFQDSQEGL